jgi:dihydrolipoamide dehydrogenase
MTEQTDIAILGSGPGGYIAALRAAQLGARVALIEENEIGGVCLNRGCIPTKALLRTAQVYRMLQDADSFGLRLDGTVIPDWAAIRVRKERIVRRLAKGVEVLLRTAGVHVSQGRGRFVAPRVLEVTTAESVERVEAKNIVVATGSRPADLPLPGMSLPGVIDSTGALALQELPGSLLIVGGGAVGVEFAEIFDAFGVQVTVVEMLDRLLPQMDADLGSALAATLKRRGVAIHLNSRLNEVTATDGTLRATISTPQGEATLEVDQVLIAAGRKPNVEDLGLEAAGVRVAKNGIPVDAHMQTNVPGVYAIGDVTGQMLLAHVAMEGGKVAAENALGQTSSLTLKTVPACAYTDPEVASVGLSEAQARDAGYTVQVGRFPLTASGKAVTWGTTEGFVKIVTDASYGEILGMHIVAPHASDLIHEAGLALTLEATLDELIATIHGHPTLGEAIYEAALQARGEALHISNRRAG